MRSNLFLNRPAPVCITGYHPRPDATRPKTTVKEKAALWRTNSNRCRCEPLSTWPPTCGKMRKTQESTRVRRPYHEDNSLLLPSIQPRLGGRSVRHQTAVTAPTDRQQTVMTGTTHRHQTGQTASRASA